MCGGKTCLALAAHSLAGSALHNALFAASLAALFGPTLALGPAVGVSADFASATGEPSLGRSAQISTNFSHVFLSLVGLCFP